MDKIDLVLIWLSLQIAAVMSVFWMKAEKRVSYLEGQQAIYQWQTEALNDGVCEPYTKKEKGTK